MNSKKDFIAEARAKAVAGDHRTALRLCDEALARNANDLGALRLSARLALRLRDAKTAALRAARVVARRTGDVSDRRFLAQALAASGDLAGAITSLEEALRRHPDDLLCRCELGRFALVDGRPDDAIGILRSACERTPHRPEPFTYLALALFETARAREAIAAARQAVRLGEGRPGPLGELGKKLLDAGAVQEARIAFERAMQRDPKDLDSCAGLSRACNTLGQTANAIEAAREVFRRMPVYVRATSASEHRVLVLEYLYDGCFKERRYGANIFRFMNFVSGLEPGRLSFHHYYLNRDDPVGDLRKLGQFDAVINNLANGERVAALGLAPLIREIADLAGVPLINAPEGILATRRDANYTRLAKARGFVFPKTVAVDVPRENPETALDPILAQVAPPMILRSVFTHAGKRASLVRNTDEVRDVLPRFAGEKVYAIRYLECRDTDGVARRYRLVAIGGELIPVNMHAAHDWNVHGDERTEHDWQARGLDKAERAFLEDPASILGGDPAQVFRDLIGSTPLDIFGVDFVTSPDHGVIVFEANSSMSFSTRRLLARYPYLMPYKEESQRRIEALIDRRVRSATT